MFIRSNLVQITLSAAFILAAVGTAGTAFAGECPAGKVKEGAVTSGPDKPVGRHRYSDCVN